MSSFFSNNSSFDSAFDHNESQEQHIEQEIKRVNRLYIISGTAIWYQQYDQVRLTDNWCKIFKIPPVETVTLADYLALIDNPEERNRVWAARESLISQPPGFEWCDTFTLHGQKIQSFAVVADGCIFGMDRAVGLGTVCGNVGPPYGNKGYAK